MPDKAPKNQTTKKKGSMADSLAVLKSSPKIMNLALLVIGYGVSHRLFEFAWKGQLRAVYPSAQAYQAGYMSHLSHFSVQQLCVRVLVACTEAGRKCMD